MDKQLADLLEQFKKLENIIDDKLQPFAVKVYKQLMSNAKEDDGINDMLLCGFKMGIILALNYPK